MPIARLQPRSALVFFLYFPWFPLPPLPPEAQAPAVTVESGAAGESQTAASAAEEPMVLPGVVIEEIPKGSALEKAGLQVGDVVLSWERLPNPPANPEGARGKIDSPLDWMWLEIEQAPRGVVKLTGERDARSMEWTVGVEQWGATLFPRLSLQTLARFRPFLDAKAEPYPKALARGWALLTAREQDPNREFACWRLVRGELELPTSFSASDRDEESLGCPIKDKPTAAALTLTAVARLFENKGQNVPARAAASAALRLAEALPSVVRHKEVLLTRAWRARVTFSRISLADFVHTKGLGSALC